VVKGLAASMDRMTIGAIKELHRWMRSHKIQGITLDVLGGIHTYKETDDLESADVEYISPIAQDVRMEELLHE
jgi:hypothetical protein